LGGRDEQKKPMKDDLLHQKKASVPCLYQKQMCKRRKAIAEKMGDYPTKVEKRYVFYSAKKAIEWTTEYEQKAKKMSKKQPTGPIKQDLYTVLGKRRGLLCRQQAPKTSVAVGDEGQEKRINPHDKGAESS